MKILDRLLGRKAANAERIPVSTKRPTLTPYRNQAPDVRPFRSSSDNSSPAPLVNPFSPTHPAAAFWDSGSASRESSSCASDYGSSSSSSDSGSSCSSSGSSD